MERILNLMLAAQAATRTGNVLRVEGKPPYGCDSVFVDSGVRNRTQPMVIYYRKDGTKETHPIFPGSPLHCAMNAASESQVRAIAKQLAALRKGM